MSCVWAGFGGFRASRSGLPQGSSFPRWNRDRIIDDCGSSPKKKAFNAATVLFCLFLPFLLLYISFPLLSLSPSLSPVMLSHVSFLSPLARHQNDFISTAWADSRVDEATALRVEQLSIIPAGRTHSMSPSTTQGFIEYFLPRPFDSHASLPAPHRPERLWLRRLNIHQHILNPRLR
jgi:hypothetical protein